MNKRFETFVLLLLGVFSGFTHSNCPSHKCYVIIPFLNFKTRNTLLSETVFQHNHPKHTAKMTTALLLKLKVMEWKSMSPDLNPIEHMWGILMRKVEKHHVSNIQQLRDVLVEEWKRMPATTCAALVNSMPRRIKAVLDNNGAPSKYWQAGQFWHVHFGCTHFCCQLFGQ